VAGLEAVTRQIKAGNKEGAVDLAGNERKVRWTFCKPSSSTCRRR